MKKIGVVTTSRADFGLLYPIMKKMESSDEFSVRVIATGMHLLKEYGYTIDYVKEKCENVDDVDLFLGNLNKYSLIKSLGIGFISFSDYLKNNEFDLIIVLGDRTELIVPVYSAMLCDIPVCHIFGGDSITNYVTYDNNIRHCITKLSSLHFTATQEHKDRIIKMGEEEWRIFNTGSPAIDYINECEYLSKNDLKKKFSKIDFDKPYCVLTFHPVPTEFDFIEQQINNIIKSLNDKSIQVVCTKPNVDIGNDIIMDKIKNEDNLNSKFLLVKSLAQEEYYSLLKHCSFAIGNSSSGVLETTSFKIPCINIGTRQAGRIREANVIDTDYSVNGIIKCIDQCLHNNSFIDSCKELTNPYGDGKTSNRILEILQVVLADKKKLLIKKNTY